MPEKDNFFESISELFKQQQLLAQQAVLQYAPVVENIILSNCTDSNRIEHTLDYMLDFCFHDEMLLLYKKLCRHYWYIDKYSTAQYIQFYR